MREAWTGDQVAWPMARGYEGQFGHVLNAPYVWIPLCADLPRRARSTGAGRCGSPTSTCSCCSPSAPRTCSSTGARSGSRCRSSTRCSSTCSRGCSGSGFAVARALRPSPAGRWLALAAVVLIAFRLTINVADSGVIDVGYAGTIGADRITHGEPLYGEGEFPDGQPLRRHLRAGQLLRLRAVRARAAVERRVGRARRLARRGDRLRPRDRRRPVRLRRCGCGRGARVASWRRCSPSPGSPIRTPRSPCSRTPTTRWSPRCSPGRWRCSPVRWLAAPCWRWRRWRSSRRWSLAPLYAAGERGLRGDGRATRSAARLRSSSPLAFARRSPSLLLAHPAIDPGLATFWERTVESQLDRSSPFSIWGQVAGLGWLQTGDPRVLAGAPRRGGRVRAPAADDRPGRGAGRRGRDRGPAHGRALVLPLHPVVLRPARA